MSAPTTAERVRALIVEALRIDEEAVVDEARLIEDLGADSLDSVDMLIAVERSFKASIPDAEFDRWRTAGDVVRYCEKRFGKGEATA